MQAANFDAKVLGKPEKFEGVQSLWGEWAFVAKSCFVMLKLCTPTELTKAEQLVEPIRMQCVSEEMQARANSVCAS